jgi:membrane-associated protein
MSFLAGIDGPVLVGVICLLVFVEECGVPVPFAPGDLLLALCGLAVRTGRVPAMVAVPAVYLATIAGAMVGREVFALAGSRLERWFAGKSRLRVPLERAMGILRRGGWPAVLAGRLTPGLRIHTTEVAGLLRLPRQTFLAGLVPGAAVYVGVFVGLGALAGRPAIGAAEELAHRVGTGLGVAALVAVLAGVALAAPTLLKRLAAARG